MFVQRSMLPSVLCAGAVIVLFRRSAFVCAQAGVGKTITWSGYTWNVREQIASGPGPNNWEASNVWMDANGFVHLKMKYSAATAKWSCAELYTTVELGFGTYRWFVEGPIDTLDRNVVLGLFTYGGTDGTNEIDVEVAKWGNAELGATDLSYTTYPQSQGPSNSYSLRVTTDLNGNYTTHSFNWKCGSVNFTSQYGHQQSPTQNVFASYQTPASFSSAVPVLKARLHMNLWGFNGTAPSDGREVEMVLHDFKYTAA